MTTEPIFPDFDVLTTPYKKVGDHEILVGIFVPKELDASRKSPVIVRFHGGLLVTGGYQHFFQTWLQAYAVKHSAVVVSLDYRLMPESNGLDMMEDLDHAWSWIFNDLQAFLGDRAKVDIDRILIKGDSAGGYLAVQSALTLGHKVKALLCVYPPADIEIPFFTKAYEKSMFNFPMFPQDTVSQHLNSLPSPPNRPIVTNVAPPTRFPLGFSAVQQGRFVDLLGSDPSLFPMRRLDTVKELPSIMILHGKLDSVVPYVSSKAWVDKVHKLLPEVKTFYHAVEGKGHGLDKFETMETDWLKEGLDFITPLWLG